MSRTILAAALALLAFTVPAHAEFLVDESVDLNFGNGHQAIGELDLVVAGRAERNAIRRQAERSAAVGPPGQAKEAAAR
jgi:hypothetical protein